MKILFIKDHRGVNGIEGTALYLLNLCKQLNKINQQYLVLYNFVDNFSDLLIQNKIHYKHLDFPRFSLFNNFKIFKLKKIRDKINLIIKQEKITHICLQDPYLQIHINNKYNLPVFCYQHTAFDENFHNKKNFFNIYLYLHRLLKNYYNKSKNIDKIICVSKASYETSNLILKIPKSKLLINKYGVENKNINLKNKNKDKNEIIILSVGSIFKAKGVEDFCKVAQITKSKNKHKNLKFIFVGGFRSKSYYNFIINKYSKYVLFTGLKKDLVQYYSTSDIFLYLSHRESAGLVLMEAMSFKLKIIASNIFGINEVIENTKSGILVDYKNHNEVSNLLMKVINQPHKSDFMKDEAYKRFKNNYSIEISTTNFINILQSFKKK